MNLAALGLARDPVGGRFDLDHLREVHRRLFGVVYPWAGHLRTVVIAKGSVFCLPQYLAGEADRVFTQLAADKLLHGLDRHGFVDRLTWYLGEVNALHPFREGNGRTQRVFLAELTTRAGWAVDWGSMTPAENVAASAASFHGDLRLLRTLLDRAVTATPDPGRPRRDRPPPRRTRRCGPSPSNRVLPPVRATRAPSRASTTVHPSTLLREGAGTGEQTWPPERDAAPMGSTVGRVVFR